MSETDITPIPKIFCCQSIFSQTGISRGSTETQLIGIQDVHLQFYSILSLQCNLAIGNFQIWLFLAIL